MQNQDGQRQQIIGREFQQNIYDLLSTIAPTILFQWDSTNSFKANFYALAALLDKTGSAQSALAHYQTRIQQFQQAMGNKLKTLTISLVTVQGSVLKTFGHQTTIGEVLQDAGLMRPTAQSQLKLVSRFTLEDLINHDADAIFLVHESGSSLTEYQKSPLWQQLKAVKTGQVYSVDRERWIVAGLLGANRILDDLFKYLVR